MADNRRRVQIAIWSSVFGAMLLLGAYALVAIFQPFNAYINPATETTWNDFWMNLINVLAAILGAVVATAILRKYNKSEPAYIIWLCFALGLWSWCLAEFIWLVYSLILVEVPVPSISDLFWILAYFLFAVALQRQFSIIRRATSRQGILVSASIGLVVLLLTIVIGWATKGFEIRSVSLGDYVNIFYPVADLTIAMVALHFVISFGRGAMARPWLGLIAFALSDSAYAWVYESGIYSFKAVTGNAPTIIADSLYVAAYLVLAIGLLSHYLLLQYGPVAFKNPKLPLKTTS